MVSAVTGQHGADIWLITLSNYSAFSRSPQYWTSFSGFSNSIHETCHALGREQNLAVFKKIFQKLLFHQQQFQDDIVEFELLKQEREKAMEEKLATWQGRVENFFNNAHQVRLLSGSVENSVWCC